MRFNFAYFVKTLMMIIGSFGTGATLIAAVESGSGSLLWWAAAGVVIVSVAMAIEEVT